MNALRELRDLLSKELEEFARKKELSFNELQVVDKLTHSIKSIDTICAMEEASDDYEGD